MPSKILLELKQILPTRVGKGNEGYVVSVAQWHDAEGKTIGKPYLSKQILILSETREILRGELRAFDTEAWALILSNFEKIDLLMRGTHAQTV